MAIQRRTSPFFNMIEPRCGNLGLRYRPSVATSFGIVCKRVSGVYASKVPGSIVMRSISDGFGKVRLGSLRCFGWPITVVEKKQSPMISSSPQLALQTEFFTAMSGERRGENKLAQVRMSVRQQ